MKKSLPHSTAYHASIVTVLSIVERGLGFLYRIVLARLLGGEGLGLYQVALSLFSVFLTIGTGGIPITVSRIFAKSKAERKPEEGEMGMSAGFLLAILLTLPVALLLFLFGEHIPFLFADARAFAPFRILLLGLSLSACYAVVRGYFWGKKQFLAPSLLELSEEAVMVICGILLLQNVSSPTLGAERASWAVVLSYLFSFTASTLCFFYHGGKLKNPKQMLKPLFNATLPITSVRMGGSIVNSLVAILLPMILLKTGLSQSESVTLFGVVTGMVLPILFIPSTLIGSLALVLVPELSEDFYKNQRERLKRNLRRGLRFSFLLACALIPFYIALGRSLGMLTFENPIAGELIEKSAVMLLPMSLSMISTSMLNSMGYEKKTFLFYFFGAGVMLLSILILPFFFGVSAYLIGLFLSFLVTAVCNLVYLHKKCPLIEKGGGQVCVHQVLLPLLLPLPLSILGKLLHLLFSTFLYEFLALTFTGLLLAVLTLFLYFLLGILPLPKRKKQSFCKK